MSVQTHRAREGATIRHWTTDSHSFVGGRERPSQALADWELADGRRRSLVASMLKLVKTQPVDRGRR
jgi:hypothetical protein